MFFIINPLVNHLSAYEAVLLISQKEREFHGKFKNKPNKKASIRRGFLGGANFNHFIPKISFNPSTVITAPAARSKPALNFK